jgi:hypothetical protein
VDVLLLKDGGELCRGLDNSLQACLEAVLEQQEASQLRLHSPNEKKFILGDILQIGQVADCLYAFAII